jgi:hypothetical protein
MSRFDPTGRHLRTHDRAAVKRAERVTPWGFSAARRATPCGEVGRVSPSKHPAPWSPATGRRLTAGSTHPTLPTWPAPSVEAQRRSSEPSQTTASIRRASRSISSA